VLHPVGFPFSASASIVAAFGVAECERAGGRRKKDKMGSDLDYAGNRIHLVGSRVLDSEHHVHETAHHHHHHHHGHGHGQGHEQLPDPDNIDRPVFKKNHAATNFELFYDLWFVANLSVFGGIHDISNEKALLSFIGYIV
jgi:hypothetical protein